MFGSAPYGATPFGAGPDEMPFNNRGPVVAICISSVVVPDHSAGSGTLIKSTAALWLEIARALGQDWSVAYSIPAHRWEEIIAGAFHREKYDEVILTPRSGDHGRDIVATKWGVGSIKVIGSVKAYASGNLVSYDDIRALLGVMSGERDVSKGIITTTSDFPPKVLSDPFIAPFLPTRLELVNGRELQRWLTDLTKAG